MKVLCIDGPARGNIHDVKDNLGGRFRFPSVTSPSHDVMYYIHRFQMSGIMFWIASVHLLVEDISPYDVFEFVISDLAKQALVER